MGSWRAVNGRQRAAGGLCGQVRTRTEALVTVEDRQRRPPAVHPGWYLHARDVRFDGEYSRPESARVGAFRVGAVWNVARNRFGTWGLTRFDAEARPRHLQAGQHWGLKTLMRSHAGAGVCSMAARAPCAGAHRAGGREGRRIDGRAQSQRLARAAGASRPFMRSARWATRRLHIFAAASSAENPRAIYRAHARLGGE